MKMKRKHWKKLSFMLVLTGALFTLPQIAFAHHVEGHTGDGPLSTLLFNLTGLNLIPSGCASQPGPVPGSELPTG
ncbi:MAG: hypothetical protein D6788_02835 [Planctomycetota bacterium]|nr:MAG: hypothetical protein D6788_02835 [Planctomycetota bacterium]